MKDYKDLKSIHSGSDIWVVGSGSSLNYVDKSFFDGKITIGLNEVFTKFDNLTYYHLYHFGIWGDFLQDKNIIMPFNDTGDNGNISCKDYGVNEDVYIYEHTQNQILINPELELAEDDRIICGWSSIIAAIHLAYFMGARNIILCGNDCGTIDGNWNIQGYNNTPDNPYNDWYKKTEYQQIELVNFLRKKGINIHSLNPFLNFGLENHIYKND